jgi:Na+/H+-dicarboxylate symporter
MEFECESVAGFVIPAGYSFNLDGPTFYISLAALTIAQAAGIQLSPPDGAPDDADLHDDVQGRGRSAAGGARHHRGGLRGLQPPGEAGVAMILAVDELMDTVRTSINVMGNCVASVVVARWEGPRQTDRSL